MARSTKDLLGFDPKELSDDALLAALKPEPPNIPLSYFSSHDGVMEFTPSCECPTCKAAAEYQAAYAKYEEQKVVFSTAALPAMLKKRVERIQLAQVRSAYDAAFDLLKERGINIIPDSECTDMGSYVIWNNWGAQDRVWMKKPGDVKNYYETLQRQSDYYGYSAATAAKERAEERVFAHPTKVVRIKGWVDGLTSSTVYEYYLDSSGRQWRRTYRNGAEYDVDSVSTTASRFSENFSRVAHMPSSVRRSAMIRLLDRIVDEDRPDRGPIDSDAYDRHSAFINALNSQPNSDYAIYRGQVMGTRSFAAAKKLYKEIGLLVRAPSLENAAAFLAAIRTLRENIGGDADRILEAWNARAASDDVRIRLGACGHIHTVSGGSAVHNGTACSTCFATHYEYAQDLDAYYPRRSMYEHYYGEDETDEDGEPRVSGWYTYRQGDGDETLGGRIKSYSANVLQYHPADTSFKPSIYGDVLMGVELEVASANGMSRAPMVKHTHTNLCNGYAIMKNDGSLPNGGFEIVTAPRTLKEHVERFGAWTPHAQLRAWDAKTCGLHVHLSSQSFSAATLGKFLEFINKAENSSIVMAVAGRTPESDANASRYCQREGKMIKGNPKKTLSGKSTERYRMVNTQNLSLKEAVRLGLTRSHINQKNIDTVELRIFRASLKKGRLLAQIEFAHAAVMFCRQASMRELEREHFVVWLRKAAGMYPNLAKWFGVKANTMTVNSAPAVCAEAEV